MTRSGLQTAVVGGGIMGACACLVLAEQGHDVCWYATEEPPRRSDGAQARAYALSPDTVRLLDALGVWAPVAERARAVGTMEVYPRTGEGGFTCLSAEDVSSDYLAQILGHAELLRACEDRLRGIARIRRDTRFPVDIEVGSAEAMARLVFDAPPDGSVAQIDPHEEYFDLVVAADGAGSFLRRRSGILWGQRDYGQAALVMALESTEPHGGVACQWFGTDRILALLPLAHERQLSMVYSLPNNEARQWAGDSPQEIARRVSHDAQHRWGSLSALSLPVMSPLAMTLVERPALGRLLLLGDAAHTVHPLAGYGLNLGMQDLRGLQKALGPPQGGYGAPGERRVAASPLASGAVPIRLRTLALQRAGSVRRVQWGLDALWRAMRLEGPGMQAARQIGIHCIGGMPMLRRWLIRQALGPAA